MKKIIKLMAVCFILTAVISLLPVAASAAESSCTVIGDFESIEYNGRTYVPFEMGRGFLVDWYNTEIDNVHVKSEIADLYSRIRVYVYDDANYILQVYLSWGTASDTLYYIEDVRLEGCTALIQTGEGAAEYLAESLYTYDDYFSFKPATVDSWISGDKKICAARDLAGLEYTNLYAVDRGGGIMAECGLIFRDEDGGNSRYYLLLYRDYEVDRFYADGSFALSSNMLATFYLLGDDELSAQLTEYWDTVPEDELDWMYDSELPNAFYLITNGLLFVLLPLAGIVAAVILLVKTRARAPYNVAVPIFMAGCVAMIVGYIVMAIMSY